MASQSFFDVSIDSWSHVSVANAFFGVLGCGAADAVVLASNLATAVSPLVALLPLQLDQLALPLLPPPLPLRSVMLPHVMMQHVRAYWRAQ